MRVAAAKESADEFRLFDLSTNRPSTAYTAELGIQLFGIDADGFEKSAYLSQILSDSPKENATVTAKLTGLFEEVNDMGSYDVAMEIIDKSRKRFELKGGKGRVADLTNSLIEAQAEADRLRELLPTQEEQQRALQKQAEEIGRAEQEKEKLTQLGRLLEAKERHEEECARAEDAISQWEEERQVVLNGFRDRSLPTDEELAEMRSVLGEFRARQGNFQSAALTEEETQRIARLKEKYPTGVPSASAIAELQARLTRVNTMRAQLEAHAPLPDSKDQTRFENTGIPDTTVLDGVTEQLDHAEELQRRLTALSNTPVKAKRGIPLWISVVALLSGIGSSICGLLFEGLTLPLLAVGAVLLAVGLLTLLMGGRGAKKAEAKRAAELKILHDQLETSNESVRVLLKQYNSLPTDNNYSRALTDLCYAAKNARADREAQKKRREELTTLQHTLKNSEQELEGSFAAYGLLPFPTDPQAALNQMFSDTREWQQLTERDHRASARRQSLQTDLRELQDRLVAFFDRLTEKPEKRTPEDCIRTAEELCRRHAILLGNIRQKKQELATRRQEYARSAPSALPNQDELTERMRQANERLELLRQAEAEQKRVFNRTVEQTQSLPELEDRCAYLKSEQAQAKKDLDLLKKTAELLTEAKDALSTRYLGGMQEHFSHFRRLLDGDDIADATIDTAFEVTVREGGKSREEESFSRGSRDILRLCARLALTKSMFSQGETPFLILDDPFVNLDEAHLASARELLNRLSEEFQIIYLVCHSTRK